MRRRRRDAPAHRCRRPPLRRPAAPPPHPKSASGSDPAPPPPPAAASFSAHCSGCCRSSGAATRRARSGVGRAQAARAAPRPAPRLARTPVVTEHRARGCSGPALPAWPAGCTLGSPRRPLHPSRKARPDPSRPLRPPPRAARSPGPFCRRPDAGRVTCSRPRAVAGTQHAHSVSLSSRPRAIAGTQHAHSVSLSSRPRAIAGTQHHSQRTPRHSVRVARSGPGVLAGAQQAPHTQQAHSAQRPLSPSRSCRARQAPGAIPPPPLAGSPRMERLPAPRARVSALRVCVTKPASPHARAAPCVDPLKRGVPSPPRRLCTQRRGSRVCACLRKQ